VLGAAYYTGLSYAVNSPLAFFFIQGIGLLVILLVLPGGLGGSLYDVRDAVLRWIAERRGIVVASLLADRRVDGTAAVAEADEPLATMEAALEAGGDVIAVDESTLMMEEPYLTGVGAG